MKRLIPALLVASALATPAFATPQCDVPTSGNIVVFEFEIGDFSEIERAQFYELRLRMKGIDARQTTFWNNCIQTTVRENGKIHLRYYDPWTLEEVPLD